MKEETKKYPEEFKKQIVELYENDKSVINLAREYGLVEQTIYKWIHRYETVAKYESGKDVSQADINAMKKRIAELEMEGENVSLKRVQRKMIILGIKSVVVKKINQ